MDTNDSKEDSRETITRFKSQSRSLAHLGTLRIHGSLCKFLPSSQKDPIESAQERKTTEEKNDSQPVAVASSSAPDKNRKTKQIATAHAIRTIKTHNNAHKHKKYVFHTTTILPYHPTTKGLQIQHASSKNKDKTTMSHSTQNDTSHKYSCRECLVRSEQVIEHNNIQRRN